MDTTGIKKLIGSFQFRGGTTNPIAAILNVVISPIYLAMSGLSHSLYSVSGSIHCGTFGKRS